MAPWEAIRAELEAILARTGRLSGVEVRQLSSRATALVKDKVKQGKERISRTKARVTGSLRRRITGDEAKSIRRAMRRYMDRAPVISLIDRLAFTMGIMNLVLTCVVLALFPQWFWAYYLAWTVPLLIIRAYTYTCWGWFYFLLDNCYAVNFMSILSLTVMWGNVSFFKSVYMLATGPLAWAIPVWRNSLVFHDIDKITSIFIHAFPGMLVFCMRWYPNMHNQAVCVEDALQLPYATDAERVSVTPLDASANGCAITWYEGVVQPLLFYLLWQAAYVVKTDIWDAPKIKADPSIATSVRWLTRGKLGFLARKVLSLSRKLGVMGPNEEYNADTWKTKCIFMVVQLVYTISALSLSMWFYGSLRLHAAFGALMFLDATWNGANYYFVVFTRSYQRHMLERAQRAQADETPRKPARDAAAAAGATAAAAAAAEQGDGVGEASDLPRSASCDSMSSALTDEGGDDASSDGGWTARSSPPITISYSAHLGDEDDDHDSDGEDEQVEEGEGDLRAREAEAHPASDAGSVSATAVAAGHEAESLPAGTSKRATRGSR